MGRKKKEIVKEVPTLDTQVSNTTSSSLVYKGNVTIKLMQGNKPVRTIKRHNIGCAQLFNFMTSCLSGTYDGNNRPKYIRCFDATGITPTEQNLGVNAFIGEGEVACTSSDQEVPTSSGTTYRTLYKFIIPSSLIKSNISGINVIALYSTLHRNDNAPSAFMILGEPISVNDLGAGINLLIL